MRNNRNRKPRNSNSSSNPNPNPNNKGANGHNSNANHNNKGANNGHAGNASGGSDGHKKSLPRHKDGVQYLSYSDKQSKNFYYWLSDMSNQGVYDKLTYPWHKLFQHHDTNMIKLPLLENGEPIEPIKGGDGRYDEIEFIKFRAAYSENQIRSKEAKIVFGIITEHLSFRSLSRIRATAAYRDIDDNCDPIRLRKLIHQTHTGISDLPVA